MFLFRNSSTRSRWQCELSARAKTQCQISEDAPRRIFSGNNSVHARESEKGKKKKIKRKKNGRVDDRVEKPWRAWIGRGWTKGASLRAQGGPCTAEYAYRTRPPIVIPHRRCQALLTRQFCHGNAPTLYFNARKEIIRVNMGKRGRSPCARKLVRSMKNFRSRRV